MAVNAYSKGPVAYQNRPTYVSQHVGLPLDYMQMALASKQEAQNQQLSQLQEVQDMGRGLQALPGDQDLINGVQQEIEQFASQLSQQDLTTRENQQVLQENIRRIASNKALAASQSNAAKYQQALVQARELDAKGELHTAGATLMQRQLQAYAQSGGAAAGNELGEFRIQKALDQDKKLREYASSMHADGSQALASISAGEDGSLYYERGYKGIGDQKVQQTALAVANDWLNSGEGQQRQLDYQAQGASPAQARKQTLVDLQQRLSSYQYSETTTNAASALNELRREKRADRKEKEKETKEAQVAYLPFGQIAPDLGDKPSFDEFGKVEKQVGGWEAAKGLFEQNSNLPLTQRLGASLYFGVSTLFGNKEATEVASNLLKQKETKLQEAAAMSNRVRQEMGLPQISEKEYFETNNTFRPQQAPVLQDKKAQEAAQEVVVGNGYFYNTTLYDQSGKQNLASDVIKADDKVKVTTNPFQTWSTPFSPMSVGLTVTDKDGTNPRTFIMDMGSHLKQIKQPRTPQEAQALNEYNKALIKHNGVHTFTEWDISTGKLVPRKRRGIYDQSIASEPLIEDAE